MLLLYRSHATIGGLYFAAALYGYFATRLKCQPNVWAISMWEIWTLSLLRFQWKLKLWSWKTMLVLLHVCLWGLKLPIFSISPGSHQPKNTEANVIQGILFALARWKMSMQMRRKLFKAKMYGKGWMKNVPLKFEVGFLEICYWYEYEYILYFYYWFDDLQNDV